VAYATACTYTIAKAVQELFESLHKTGTTAGFEDRMMSFDEFNRLVGLERIREQEEAFL
jgi:methylisocitrate lyase